MLEEGWPQMNTDEHGWDFGFAERARAPMFSQVFIRSTTWRLNSSVCRRHFRILAIVPPFAEKCVFLPCLNFGVHSIRPRKIPRMSDPRAARTCDPMRRRSSAHVAETPGVTMTGMSTNATPPRNGWDYRLEILGKPAAGEHTHASTWSALHTSPRRRHQSRYGVALFSQW